MQCKSSVDAIDSTFGNTTVLINEYQNCLEHQAPEKMSPWDAEVELLTLANNEAH